jgi:hypothetical protein
VKDLQREILSQVAAGTLSAEEGAARLEALETETIAFPSRPAPTSDSGSGVKQVRVFARLGNTEIIGDATVNHAVAGRIRIPSVDIGGKLIVRMNPALALAARTQAGNLQISGVTGAIAAEVQAGNSDIADFRGSMNLKVTAGNITAKGHLDSGASAIRCQMGEVRVVLDKSSSVRIRARTTLGEIAFENIEPTGKSEVTIGSGAGTLDCDCTMGTIRIAVE